ncbi:9682_t:CDS:2 [Funneliformis caledonium]|uniref:9682_t:CDS:1 n=1 Tax=Funneliformis caledonium TaxID=1117310 RepID=A0A9N9GF30_9GLOM|nr:9682_t:CDS:2 [Funneliformis caledonium]
MAIATLALKLAELEKLTVQKPVRAPLPPLPPLTLLPPQALLSLIKGEQPCPFFFIQESGKILRSFDFL